MKLATLLSVSVLASCSAFAASTATSENVLGVLRVDSTAVQTIVSVPWVDASAGGETGVKVVDLVKTSTLSEGDELYWYDSSKGAYQAWRLTEQKTWEAGTGVTSDGIAAATDSNKALPRGDALILKRTNPATPGYFFLCGQYTTSSAQTSIAVGSSSAPAFTLLASPTASAGKVDLNAATWTGVGASDNILVNDKDGKLTILTYADGNWGQPGYTKTMPPVKTHVTDAAKIDAGLGVWYKSVKGTGTITVKWN